VGIPLGAFLFLAALILAFSRILLAVPEELAPWVALLFATNILVGCALAATIRGTRGFVFLVAVLVLTIVGGGVAGAVLGERPVESLVEEEAAGPPPPAEGMPPPPGEMPPDEETPAAEGPAAGAVHISAQGIAFDTSEIALPAQGEAAIAFENRDPGTPHNVAVYTEAGGDPIFQGEVITGPDSIEYRFPAPDPGSYYFQCDIHPQMNGSVTAG
jgi:plastocyanin